jgi:hypothetical protein
VPDLPIPDNAIIKPDDGMLLQFAFSQDIFESYGGRNMPTLMHKFLAGSGNIFSSAALRHAVMAFAAHYLRTRQFQPQEIEHSEKASRALRMKTVDTVDDTDLFAAWILMDISNVKSVQEIHRDGMLSILHILLSKASKESRASNIFAPFRPMFTEHLLPGGLQWPEDIKRHAKLYCSMASPDPTWAERCRMLSELWGNSNMETIPGSNILVHAVPVCEALRYDLFDMIFTLPLVGHSGEEQNREWDQYLELLLTRWKGDIDSPECRQLLVISEQMLGNDEISWGCSHNLAWACVTYLSVRFLLLLLTGVTVLEAIRSYEASLLLHVGDRMRGV